MSAADPMAVLERFGPETKTPAPSRDDAWAYVHELTTSHDENFSVLSRLVPARLRDDFAAVYAFCRWADDLGDETGDDDAARDRSRLLLAWWRRELEDCAAAAADPDAPRPRHPVYITLAETIARRGLSPRHFGDLISAFEQDQDVRRYQSWDELLGYCRLSANPVGRLVLELAGYRIDDPDHAPLFEMADATCTALQLTNHWQDVRRDLLERDRVYLPEQETGLTAQRMRRWVSMEEEPLARVAFIKALRPLVARTRDLFAAGAALPGALANEMTPVVWLFGAGGSTVLQSIEHNGCATLWHRPKLSKPTKAKLVLQASLRFRGVRARRAPAA